MAHNIHPLFAGADPATEPAPEPVGQPLVVACLEHGARRSVDPETGSCDLCAHRDRRLDAIFWNRASAMGVPSDAPLPRFGDLPGGRPAQKAIEALTNRLLQPGLVVRSGTPRQRTALAVAAVRSWLGRHGGYPLYLSSAIFGASPPTDAVVAAPFVAVDCPWPNASVCDLHTLVTTRSAADRPTLITLTGDPHHSRGQLIAPFEAGNGVLDLPDSAP